ncbi:hypothetical protein SAMN05421856_11270 [Chryseobacterium taichungense]|uniref:Uncharacterized protein n=1 Tax=Chryseobacterium taichungense TaxID=295069 RepID=A0A1H8DCJ2_9FLAO|nr:hypothetical protein [Chryseobacterium taichungense]SEN04207.1 hypothetical protein SAMN05421856_11270 [Chryseobacterium taichungense]
MEKIHTYHLEKHKVDIDIIEFEHQHFYLKVSQLESILNVTFDNWLETKESLKHSKAELYYDQYGYQSANQYIKDIVKNYFDGEIICSDVLIFIYINNFDSELYSEIWKIIDFLRNQYN